MDHAVDRFLATAAYAKLANEDNLSEQGDGGGEDEEIDEENETPTGQSQKRKRRLVHNEEQEFAFQLEEGRAVLTLPQGLGADSAEDLKDWLKLVVRKINRASGVQLDEDE